MYSLHKYKTAIVGLLLLALVLLASNAAYNWHVHRFSDGSVLVHAHPYKDSTNGVPNHSHDSKEYFTIQQLTAFLFVVVSAFVISLTDNKFIELRKTYDYHVRKNLLITLFPQRGPPLTYL